MGIVDRLRERVQQSFNRGDSSTVGGPTSPIESLTKAAPYGLQIEVLRMAAARLGKGEGSDIDHMLVETMGRAGMQNTGQVWKGAKPNDRRLESALGENISGYIGINDYGFKGKRQYIADRRYLLDLYVVAYNNADVRTAITHQRNEIFRRGFDWVQSWDYKCPVDDEEFTAIDARKLDYKHKHKIKTEQGVKEVEVDLEQPDEGQKVEFDKFIESCNYFGQSLETILRECWDDINVVDDAFIFISKEYTAEQKVDEDNQPTGEWEITGKPKFIFRLDPVLVEFDLDQRGIPGMRHHICLLHRDELLEVPPGEGWELEWKGKCPTCNLPTYPTIFKYNESYLQGGYGTAQAKVLYLTAEEVIHWSYYTPCYDDQTEIMTPEGWRRFADLTDNDFVAQRGWDGDLEWVKPIRRYELPYAGKMWHAETQMVDLMVTPNHKLWIKEVQQDDYRMVEARNLPDWNRMQVPAVTSWRGWPEKEPSTFTLPEYRSTSPHGKYYKKPLAARDVAIEPWLAFLGYYVAEGCLTPKGIQIRQKKEGNPVYAKIKATLDTLALRYTEGNDRFIIWHPGLREYLMQFGKARDKFIPREFKNLSPVRLQILWQALMDGDGHITAAGRPKTFVSTSRQLLDDMGELSIKLGMSVTFRYGDDINKLLFRAVRGKEPTIKRHQHSWVDYVGIVYCVEVPTHAVMVRRNGKVCWSGNSELYGYPPILSIYEKALTLIGMDRYIYDYFYERKVPQGIISTVTDDPKGIESVKSEMQARMQQDPHYIPWIAVSAKTGQGKTEFVRFAYTLDELNYLPVRDEIRDRIAGIYGVSAIWMSSVQGIGGLNAESQQLTVMSRVVEGAQRIFHEQVFPALMTHFGVTDWEMELATPEEDSELAELQIKQSKATLAQTWQAIGFGIEYDQEKDEYTVTGSVPSMQEQQQQAMEQQSIMGEQGQEAGGQFPGAGAGGGGGAPAPPPADVGEQMD